MELSSLKILVAEDETALMMIVEKALTFNGFQVIRAADGLAAVNAVVTLVPDLVILDLMLPRMSGFKVLEVIRENAETREIPVIILSARAQKSDVERGLGTGADRYVTKPFSPIDLVAQVKELLVDRGLLPGNRRDKIR